MKLILNQVVERWIPSEDKPSTKDCYFAKLQKEIDLVEMNYSLLQTPTNEITIVGKHGLVFKSKISSLNLDYINHKINANLPDDIENSETKQEYLDYLTVLQEDGWEIVV